MEESTITAMSRALGGDIPFLPARTDFNLLDAILIQPRPAYPMVAASVNLAEDSPEELGLQVVALRENIRSTSPGDITLTASFGRTVAAASLSNSQQSDVELKLAIRNMNTKSIMHGNHLQDFLTRNIIKFLEANLTAVGNKILRGQVTGTQRMALGFVAKCTTAKIVMSQTVEKTSSNQADGRAGAGLQAEELREKRVHLLK
jgi:hypothetical protein